MDNSYKKLDAYIMAKELVKMVYDATKRFPDEEKFVLCNQIRRAAISVPSNIAEGISRASHKEQIHFIEISFGSLNEVMCQVEIANELGMIAKEHLQLVEEYYRTIAQMLSGLRRSIIESQYSDNR